MITNDLRARHLERRASWERRWEGRARELHTAILADPVRIRVTAWCEERGWNYGQVQDRFERIYGMRPGEMVRGLR